MKILPYILSILVFAGCKSQHAIPKEASEYLTETLALLEENSVNQHQIDWKAFKIDVFERAKHVKDIKDTYPVISYAVSQLHDNHSYFKPITEAETTAENAPLPVLTDEITPADIGYIRIPFCIGTADDCHDYISTIRTKIALQSKKKLKGWIVDLRGNFGGNMWPMLLSLEPLIGNGTLGYFVDANESSEAWKMIEGKAYIADQLVMETKIVSKQDLSNQFLAVLTDNQTASSGEAVAVAFKLRENSKSFGQPTFGVSTGCVSHELSDGSIINLAESTFADRGKTKFGKSIIPDFQVEENETLKAGIEWIYQMNRN